MVAAGSANGEHRANGVSCARLPAAADELSMRRTAPQSHNVALCRAIKATQALSQGLWNTGALSPYLFLLMGNSKTVRPLRAGICLAPRAAAALPSIDQTALRRRHELVA